MDEAYIQAFITDVKAKFRNTSELGTKTEESVKNKAGKKKFYQ